MTCYIVLGCPHSGTSLVAGLLHQNGVYMGTYFDFDPPDAEKVNPRGYWEDRTFTYMSQRLLHCTGGSHLDPPERDAVVKASLAFRDQIGKRIEIKAQNAGDAWGWKDPRTIIVWPAYRPHLTDTLDPRIIFTHRNPLHIARAWLRHAQLDDESYALSLAAEYERLMAGIASEWPYPALHLAFEDWWYRITRQQAALDGFLGRGLDYSHFDRGLWRS